MGWIDFRSDTVTRPTDAMREAMAQAEVGDDVYGEDPTVNRLETMAAQRLRKEAGLFVASGTMGNLVAMLVHAQRGDEAIMGTGAHTYDWEAGGMAVLGGVVPRLLPVDDEGRMDPAEVAASVRDDDPHLPRTRLLLVENTFGGLGGLPLPADYFSALRSVATQHDLAVHLDGARLFNAARSLQVNVADLVDDVDSVTFCLSKGLCAPVGSVLCGTRKFIDQARRTRKLLGGGMRQAGILAAAGIIALEQMTERLDEDHRNAQSLARGLAELPGIRIDVDRVRTNIVHFELETSAGPSASDLVQRLSDREILVGQYPPDIVRAVTHRWIDEEGVRAFLDATRSILARG